MNAIKDDPGIPLVFFRQVDTILCQLHLWVTDLNNREQICCYLAQYLQLTSEHGPSITNCLMTEANTPDEIGAVQLTIFNQEKVGLQNCLRDMPFLKELKTEIKESRLRRNQC